MLGRKLVKFTTRPPKTTEGITANGVTCEAVIMFSNMHEIK